MKKINILLTSLMAGAASCAMAQRIAPVEIDSISFNRHGEYMVVDMTLDLSRTDVKSTRALLLTPSIVSGADSLALPAVGVYGRQRYYYSLRNDSPVSGADETMFRVSERPDSFAYHAMVPYAEWMNGSDLRFTRGIYGCVNCLIDQKTDLLTDYFHINPAIPEIVYIHPKGKDEKVDSLEGSAFIDFPVDQTVIYPDYRNNVRELGKIQASIDSVRADKDVTITEVWLKGFASPESPYSHNTDLAIGRTAALKKHIGQLYHFPDGIITTDYEPEDWAGLRRFVTESNIDHRDEILALIDSDMEPDAKEARIKRLYPQEYKFMLQNFYPALRHTDYRINYRIRRFTDINEIRRVMQTNPSRLDLNEFYLLAQACEPGSDEFNDVFETAARMYPTDPVANINAANSALQRKDYTTAEHYLAKAGDTPQAVYTRGALAFLKGDYAASEQLMRQAEGMGITQAADVISEIRRIQAHTPKKTNKIQLD